MSMSPLDALMQAIAVANTYTDETVVGGGAIKGKNCTIQSIEPVSVGNKITFLWTLDDGTEITQSLIVTDGTVEFDDLTPEQQASLKGDPGEPGPTGKGIKRSYLDPSTNHVIVVYDDDTTDDWGELTSVDSATLQSDMTAAIAVGGITAGTEYPAGTSLEAIFRDMLEPTLYPTLTNPSASLTATGAKLLEAGATLDVTFTLSFNRGSINPAYGTSGYRAGAATSYTLDGVTQETNTFSKTITSAKTSYQGSVAYAEGEQPKDSTGKNYNSPLPAGSVNSSIVNYEFVDALWANVASIATIAKQALVSKSAKQKDFNFPAQTVANPEVFDVPASWTVTAVQVKNDLSGLYEDALSQFTVTDTTHEDAAGNSVAYKRYTFNLGYDTGARSVRLKWS